MRKLFSAQPLDDIAEYFGVKVAFYFAWLGHYTCALSVPAIFGTILWASLYDRSQVAQDIGHVIFSLFNVVWASLYLEAWRRYSVQLAFQWGTLSTPPELLEPPRALYKVRRRIVFFFQLAAHFGNYTNVNRCLETGILEWAAGEIVAQQINYP